MTNSKQSRLDQLAQSIIDDDICPKLREGATQLVFGVGSSNAQIVFIGEAPGQKEDQQGEPFVGAAGKFLNEMLAGIGLERKDIYITNIVKYRPPSNRDPEAEEKAAFWPYLLRQLLVIEPKLIVTLGRHSMEHFLPDKKISQIHGQPKRIRINMAQPNRAGGPGASAMQGTGEQRTEAYRQYAEGAAEPVTQQRAASDSAVASSAREQGVTSWVILPLFHPAAGLYNGGQRQTLIDDFAKIPAVLELIDKDKP